MCILRDNTHFYTASYFFPIITKKGGKETEVPKFRPWQREKKKQKIKPPYLSEEYVCHVSREQAERGFAQTKNPKELKCLFNFRQINGKGAEIPQILTSRWEIGTGYSAELGHERECKHISETGAPSGL